MSTQAVAPTRTAATPVVTAAPALLLHRMCDCGQHTAGGGRCDDCKKKKLALPHRATTSFAPSAAPRIVHEVLRSSGEPLDDSTRVLMESRLGHDFRHVRVHADARAGDSAKAVDALAYTVARHITFANGQYDNGSRGRQRLLQHELVHTIQQSHISDEQISAAEGSLEIGDPNSPLEHRANAEAAVPKSTDHHPTSSGERVALRRQATNSPTSETDSASDSPSEYDGCQDPKAIAGARANAAQHVKNAVDLLQETNIQKATPLLDAHFHLDFRGPGGADNLKRIRSQFDRMNSSLASGIRIFCRSAPRVGSGSLRPTMPVDDACRTDRAHSTSCAGGNATATVTLCETALAEEGASLVKTIIHEFAHVACNGDPPIQSGGRTGGEVYYDGSRLPGDAQNVLNQADSYAWFAMKAAAAAPATAPDLKTAGAKKGGSRAGWWALLGVAAALAIGGIFAPGLLLGAGIAGLIGILGVTGAFEHKPVPTSIRVVQDHQVPIDEAAVRRGWRSGFGGVTELEVSNGDTDYDGSEIKEYFVRGHCENANISGQGGTGGSTFTVGRGVSNNDLGTPISLPGKRNTFYDQHLHGDKSNVLPPGTHEQFSICVQQYTFDDQVIAGKSFQRRYDFHRANVAGQDVASFHLTTSEEGPAQNPAGNPSSPGPPGQPEKDARPPG